MVKNQVGGNKGKKVARKDNIQSNKLRFSNDEDELYGISIKMLGNNQFHVLCLDQVTRLCFIRKKFTGKHKHHNLIKEGIWVLIGKRSWETKNDKIEKCDLLEIYDDQDKKILHEQSNINLEFLSLEEKKRENEDIDDDIVFEDEIDLDDI
tara:strand:+ start:87 stop:539 length:453 start_codon:yes stop_codon:yes gene_type:complete